MKFLKTAIRNYRAFRGNHTFEFDDPGIYYVTGKNLHRPRKGPNGIGKSTLFDAFFWCWTGRSFSDNRPGSAIEPWRSKNKTSVANHFEMDDGSRHIIERTRRPNSLQMDGEEISQADLLDWLGMSEDNLRRTVIIPQEASLFMSLAPEAQSRMFSEMLDADRWITGSEYANKQANFAERTLREAESQRQNIKGSWESLNQSLDEARKSNRDFRQMRKEKIEATEIQYNKDYDRLEAHVEKKPPEPRKIDIQGLQEGLRREKGLLESAHLHFNTASNAAARLERDLNAAREDLKRYRDAEPGRCPECGQEVDKKHITDKIKKARERVAAYIAAFEEGTEALDRARNGSRAIASRVQALEDKIAATRAGNEELGSALQSWQSTYTRLQTQLALSKREFEDAKALENPHSKTIERYQIRLEEISANLAKVEKECEDLQKKISTYRFWAEGFKTIRLNIIDETLLEVQIAADRQLELLGLEGWHIEFATEREGKGDQVQRGFTASVWPQGEADPIKWQSFSGGEKQRAQLAITFALSEVLLARAGVTINFEVLDEPTIHLSEEGIDDLVEALHERAVELDRAIYFVDHHSLDRGAFDGVVFIEHDKEGSRIR